MEIIWLPENSAKTGIQIYFCKSSEILMLCQICKIYFYTSYIRIFVILYYSVCSNFLTVIPISSQDLKKPKIPIYWIIFKFSSDYCGIEFNSSHKWGDF